MAKIALATEKYIIYAKFEAAGIVEKPDIIGAVFGQTEGLLGDELELRELQKSGRIGRIDVDLSTRDGRSEGVIKIPSSLSKEETALVAAAVETIDRVGPCEAKLKIDKVEDVRMEKRQYIMGQAKKILDGMIVSSVGSSEMSRTVKSDYRISKIGSYGSDALPAGPEAESSSEIVLVEGRADVLNLLKAGIKNCVSIEGTAIPPSVVQLSKDKSGTIFVDGDRGGDLIIKELMQKARVDFFAKAPDGKEVEELTQKEILQCLRNRKPIAEFSTYPTRQPARDYSDRPSRGYSERPRREYSSRSSSSRDGKPRVRRDSHSDVPYRSSHDTDEPRERAPFAPSRKFPEFQPFMRRAMQYSSAILLGPSNAEIGEVPAKELSKVLDDLGNDSKVEAVVVGSTVTQEIVDAAQRKGVKYLAGARRMYSKKSRDLTVLGLSDL
ncbi:MAG: DNA primase DnaG [archaeon]